jgi:hypothetical protein
MRQIGSLLRAVLVGGALLAASTACPVRAGAQQIDYNTQIKNKPSAIGFPIASDHIQFVSPNGNDANDGLSWASAKLTCAAAIAALGGNNAVIYESPALAGSDCVAATGSTTGLNGYLWSPNRFYLGPSAQASLGNTGTDSKRLRWAGSVWNGSAAVDDFWEIYVNSFPGAFSSGSNLIISHSSVEDGAGRVLLLTDEVIANPRDATVSVNSNSFAFDNQGAYYEGGSQTMLWEMANTVDHNGAIPVTFRQNFVPIFGSACSGCSAEVAFGGSGTLGVSGNYSGAPKWLWTNLNGNFNTATWAQNFTAPHTITAVDADSNTIRPLVSPGSDHKWVQYVDSAGVQNRTQAAFTDISGTATASQVTAAGAAGQIQFNNTSLAADSNLFWDNTNKRLGIGQATPAVPLHLKTTGSGGAMQLEIENAAAGGTTWYVGSTDSGNGAGGGKLVINSSTSTGSAILTLDSATQNVGISQTSPAKPLDVNGSANIAKSLFTGINTVAFSATPNFDLNLGNTQTITLSGNVTSATIANSAAGQIVVFIICQDATGGRTFVWPAQFHGAMTIGATASKCSAQDFVAKDASNYYALGPGVGNQ